MQHTQPAASDATSSTEAFSIEQIYNTIFGGDKVSIGGLDRRAHESLRSQLCKLHQRTVLLELTNDSVCADYSPDLQVSVFWLGTKRVAAKKFFNVSVTPANPSQEDGEVNGQ